MSLLTKYVLFTVYIDICNYILNIFLSLLTEYIFSLLTEDILKLFTKYMFSYILNVFLPLFIEYARHKYFSNVESLKKKIFFLFLNEESKTHMLHALENQVQFINVVEKVYLINVC